MKIQINGIQKNRFLNKFKYSVYSRDLSCRSTPFDMQRLWTENFELSGLE